MRKLTKTDPEKSVLLTEEQCCVRYSLGRNGLRRWAESLGAYIMIGRNRRYSRAVLDEAVRKMLLDHGAEI